LDVKEDTSSIVFNTSGLELGTSTIQSDSLVNGPIHAHIVIDEKKERGTVNLHSTLPAGSSAVLELGFKGVLSDDLMGYYKSSWKDDDGVTQNYTLTQFEVCSSVL
jgi:aminopeptidase 2